MIRSDGLVETRTTCLKKPTARSRVEGGGVRRRHVPVGVTSIPMEGGAGSTNLQWMVMLSVRCPSPMIIGAVCCEEPGHAEAESVMKRYKSPGTLTNRTAKKRSEEMVFISPDR